MIDKMVVIALLYFLFILIFTPYKGQEPLEVEGYYVVLQEHM